MRNDWYRSLILTLAMILLAGCNNYEPAVPPAAPKAEAPKPAAAAEKPEQRKAEFGVAAKGHDYGPGVLTTPMSIYFSMNERMVFNIKIPEAMKLFKATENRFPKSQEEFMTRIIKENDIELPMLQSGERYVYDPKTGELLVDVLRVSRARALTCEASCVAMPGAAIEK